MKLDGATVQYLLAREYGDVGGVNITRSGLYDYPILYDASSDMSGHTVLVPDHERPHAMPFMEGVLCVCLGDACAASAIEAGFPVVSVRNVTFQRLYNYMQTLFVRNERMDAQMRAYVDAHAGFQVLLDACAQAMRWSCALIDERYRIVCHSEYRPEADEGNLASPTSTGMLGTEVIDLFMASRSYQHMRQSRNVFSMPGSSDLFMKNVFSGGRLVGTLVARYGGEAQSARFVRFLLNYLCPFVVEMHERVGSFEMELTKPNFIRAALQRAAGGDAAESAALEDLLAGDVIAQTSQAGAHPGEPDSLASVRAARYLVARIERQFTNEGAEGHDYLIRRFELALSHVYCFQRDGRLYLLAVLGDDVGGFRQELVTVARDNLCKVGVSRAFAGMDALGIALIQADAALDQGGADDPLQWYYRFGDYALSWLAGRARGEFSPESVGHPAVSILLDYDAEHGTDLLYTLRVFMRDRYNATEAARDLFVARSTLLNRLERIGELTQLDLDDVDERAYLAFTFAMMR